MKNRLTYKGYTGTVEFSAEDKLFFGKIEGVDDLVSYEDENIFALENSFIEAVEDYMLTCKQLDKASS